LTARAGMRTPAIFSSDFSSLIVALLTDSKTLPLNRKKNTGIILHRIWLRQQGRKHLYIINPFVFCFQGGLS